MTTAVRKKAMNEDGFSLFELMIAAGVMLVALVLMFGTLIRISTTTAATEDRAVAATQLSSIAEDVQRMTLEQIRNYEPPAVEGLGAFQTLQVAAIAGDGSAVVVPAAAADFTNMPNPLEVRITLTWRDPSGRTFTRQISTTVRR